MSTMELTKVCTSCGIDKPLTDYYKGRSVGGGKNVKSWCKGCYNERQGAVQEAVRVEVLRHYGPACRCCGESEVDFLVLDHINDDGADHRRQVGMKGGYAMYLWAKKAGFPAIFQTLCCNCNMAKARKRGCPHVRRDR
jgi:hypothetical protein